MKAENIKLINRKIGDRLREFRHSKKMKQGEMSRVLGISVPAYSKIETGVNELTTRHLLTLKREFNLLIDWLLSGDNADGGNGFEKHEDDVRSMLADMKSSRTVLHSILSHYYGLIDETIKKRNRNIAEG